jgi:hypothetical protein
VPDLWTAIRHAFTSFSPGECRNYLTAAGYDAYDPTWPETALEGLQAVDPGVKAMWDEGHGPSAIAKALGISRMSVHRALAGQSLRSQH